MEFDRVLITFSQVTVSHLEEPLTPRISQ